MQTILFFQVDKRNIEPFNQPNYDKVTWSEISALTTNGESSFNNEQIQWLNIIGLHYYGVWEVPKALSLITEMYESSKTVRINWINKWMKKPSCMHVHIKVTVKWEQGTRFFVIGMWHRQMELSATFHLGQQHAEVTNTGGEDTLSLHKIKRRDHFKRDRTFF